ncbi:MAG: cysteine desulfurase family protein [Coriobacteriales bacterium]|jgi:cysteine desulfurase
MHEPEPTGRVYLDYAATAPFDERLVEALASSSWANANALYSEGRAAAAQLEQARSSLAKSLGAHAPFEMVFTSGGSESDTTALTGLSSAVPGARKTHVVVSSIEHDAVLNSAKSLKARGLVIDKIDPDASGIVRPATLEKMLSDIDERGDACTLVVVQAVNNEVGTVQPIRALVRVAHAHRARFFTDAVQALGKLPLDLEESGVDAASFSAHKIGAPKGVGALYLRRGTRIAPLVYGGGQESGMRSGTQNVAGARAFSRAVELASEERIDTWMHVAALNAAVREGVKRGSFAHALAPTLAGDPSGPDEPLLETGGRVPHILSFLCEGLEGETLVLRCDSAGIAVSAGSACSSGSLDPSHVILALGIPRERAFGSLRLSFGRESTEADVACFIAALPEVLR